MRYYNYQSYNTLNELYLIFAQDEAQRLIDNHKFSILTDDDQDELGATDFEIVYKKIDDEELRFKINFEVLEIDENSKYDNHGYYAYTGISDLEVNQI